MASETACRLQPLQNLSHTHPNSTLVRQCTDTQTTPIEAPRPRHPGMPHRRDHRLAGPTGAIGAGPVRRGSAAYRRHDRAAEPASPRRGRAPADPPMADCPWPSHITAWGRPPTLIRHVIPELVVEVSVDTAIDAGVWRHPARYVRLRPDLGPEDVPPSRQEQLPVMNSSAATRIPRPPQRCRSPLPPPAICRGWEV